VRAFACRILKPAGEGSPINLGPEVEMAESQRWWSLRVVVDAGALEDERAVRDLDHLRECGAHVNRHPVDAVWEAMVCLEAPSMEAATTAASVFVNELAVRSLISVEIQPTRPNESH
jgi:hypothetical protein